MTRRDPTATDTSVFRALPDDAGFSVEVLERDDNGQWTALVSVDSGELCEVTRRYGSWTTPPDESGATREILPRFAAILQEHVKREDRRHGRIKANLFDENEGQEHE